MACNNFKIAGFFIATRKMSLGTGSVIFFFANVIVIVP